MKFKKMMVWSCGNEKASVAKTDAILYGIAFTMFCVLHVLFFISDMGNPDMTIWEHILCGLCFSCILGLFTYGLGYGVIDTLKHIKQNKLIPIYLYTVEEFIKLGDIPEDKFVLFSDETGTVLAEKEFEEESEYFCSGTKYFYVFEEYYEKHAVEKAEIDLMEICAHRYPNGDGALIEDEDENLVCSICGKKFVSMKQYWLSLIIQNEGDKKAWLCAMTDSYSSVDSAMKAITKARKNHNVLSAWIDTFDKDNKKQTVLHWCFVNSLGNVDKDI